MDEIRRECLALIREACVLTLSTHRPLDTHGGSPVWAAPVYYIFKANAFYFFSSPESRHIKDGLGRDAAGSLFLDDRNPQLLKGLQMTGIIRECTGKKYTAAALDYCTRFGIKVLKDGSILEFFKHRFHAQLYEFVPHGLWYMDNRRGMGNRTQITL